MTSLLHLDSSADESESVTRRLTALFADTWRASRGAAGYRYRDLAADPVPLLGPAYCRLGRRVERRGVVPVAEVAHRATSTAEQREWARTLPLITEMRRADTVVIGVPMYNFSIPASLKAWIDRIGFPGAFTDPDTGESLLRHTRIVAVMARGGAYGPGMPREGYDFQMPYLRAYFGRLGVTEANLVFVAAEMTRAADVPGLERFRDFGESSLNAARATIIRLAAEHTREDTGEPELVP